MRVQSCPHTRTHPYTYTRIHIGKRLFLLGTFFSTFDRLLSSLPWCFPFRIIVVTSAMSSHPHPRHLPTFVTFPSLMFSLLSLLPCSVHFRTFFISLVFLFLFFHIRTLFMRLFFTSVFSLLLNFFHSSLPYRFTSLSRHLSFFSCPHFLHYPTPFISLFFSGSGYP